MVIKCDVLNLCSVYELLPALGYQYSMGNGACDLLYRNLDEELLVPEDDDIPLAERVGV